jgi:hypothetical protein
MTDQNQNIRRRAKNITGFLFNLFWYVIINIFLYWLDYSTDKQIDWA